MLLRWTEEAAGDLEPIADYLFENAPPDRAAGLAREIYEAPSTLLTFPSLGRPGKKEGTCELVPSPLPYIVIYEITGDTIHIVRILHGAQKWP
jgi:plasmid stabilization system protein ParE